MANPKGSTSGTGPSMGIDLGTTYSCVGVWRRGSPEIAVNRAGKKITPSYVAFTKNDERLVGDAAFSQAIMNPTNSIFGVKRLLGRKFYDETVQNDMKYWPFKVVSGKDNKPMVSIKYRGEDRLFSAEEISSMILCQMREIAEALLGETIQNAVITCPAYFSNSQRQATRDAGKIAELNVLRVINEPTAAAIAYGFDNLNEEEGRSSVRKNVLIFDLGGGTFDVSLLAINNGKIVVKATAGDTHLGGEDIDNNMVNYFINQYKTKNYVDITDNPKSLRKLRLACEKAKCHLSFTLNATIEIDALYDGMDFQADITRTKFEHLNDELFLKCLEPLKKCLSDAKIDKSEIDEVVLVGGSTRIPKIQELVKDFFPGKKLNHSINPDEAVALGATINAAMLVGDMKELVLMDVTPLSLGIELKGGIMSRVIPRNTPYPVERSQFVTIARENQTSTLYDIYEGEREMAEDNNLLGSFRLSGIAPAPAFAPQIQVTFRVDADGILDVTALDKLGGNSAKLTVTNEEGRLSNEEIDHMIDDGRKYKQQDEQKKKKAIAQNELEKYAYCVRNTLRSASTSEDDHRRRVETTLKEVEEWVNDQGPETEASEYDRKKMELERIFKPFKAKMKMTS